nr:hypothetical protein [Leptospira perolatii]
MALLLLSFALLFSADILIFRVAIWKVPNESPWSSNHFYNFLYEYFTILQKPKVRPRVLLVGSSIAHYSLDREDLREEILKKSGKEVDLEFLSYAGMTPLDAFLVRKEILKLKPDLVLFPINFIDWRLHRAYVLQPTGKNETILDRELLLDALDYVEAPQARYIFPWETVLEFWNVLGAEKTAEYIVASAFGFYRYKDIYWKNLSSLYEHRFGRDTSYHGYNGEQIPERVTSLGWTGKVFSFYPKKYMGQKGFYIQVVPEILKDGILTIELKNSKGISQVFEFQSPGWKNIILKDEFYRNSVQEEAEISEKVEKWPLVTATLSSTWVPFYASEENKDWNYDLMGVRLQQTFGSVPPRSGMQYTREERSEDLRYINMGDREYESYFHFRLLSEPEKRPGIGYLRVLADSKKRISKEKFKPVLHFKYMDLFLKYLRSNQIPVILINNPENPVSLSWYVNSEWYRSHLDYLGQISGNGVLFLDWKDALRPQDFSDYHHFTFPGMRKMNEKYAGEILKFVE